MKSTNSSKWFEEDFDKLDPLLQNLHINGGQLTGPVCIEIPDGIGGMIGNRIAKKLGIPLNKDDHSLQVKITHCDDGLHWDRCFDKTNKVKSIFKPFGKKSNGYWLESTGQIQLKLTVDIKEGGWYWRCIEARIKGIKIPLWLFPKTIAYKVIKNNLYYFYVGISLPIFGKVLSYNGLLKISDK